MNPKGFAAAFLLSIFNERMAKMLNQWQTRFEAKLDALLRERGIKAEDIEMPMVHPTQPTKRTPQELAAINNAPETPTADQLMSRRAGMMPMPPASSIEAPPMPPVPEGAVGPVTVETQQPDGNVNVQTIPSRGRRRS